MFTIDPIILFFLFGILAGVRLPSPLTVAITVHVSGNPKMSLVLSIEAAVECLQQGGVVAIPTETVYGLAADASQPQAIKRIFSIKGRPADHPLIVHIARVGQLPDWACDIPDLLEPLAERFWPGPLTVVLKKQAHVSELVTGGQDTIALRIPDHPVALHILSALNRGLCAPSANRFGRVSPTTAQQGICAHGVSATPPL